jgi:hypothetical protein
MNNNHRPSGHQINTADQRRRQLRVMQVILAGAAAIAMLALFDAARPDTAQTVLASGSVRLVDMAADVPARASAPFGELYPQTPSNLVGSAGFAADDSDDQTQQQAQQQMQQAEQQAEEQQELANQEAQQAEQQGLQTEQQANLSSP